MSVYDDAIAKIREDKSRLIRVIGHLDELYIQQLEQALCAILGLFRNKTEDSDE